MQVMRFSLRLPISKLHSKFNAGYKNCSNFLSLLYKAKQGA